MNRYPLIAHAPEAVLAYRHGQPITAAQFLFEAQTLARQLPASQHLLNACHDRYHFVLGLAAALIADKCSVLPSTHTPEVIRQLREFAPDVFCLTDHVDAGIELPTLTLPRFPTLPRGAAFEVPQLDATQRVAYIFTSGSTGAPLPHDKYWGPLVQSVRAEALRLFGAQPLQHTLVGTVPAQHMYGFESTVLLPLQSGAALCAERPFYPADIVQSLAAVPAPRVLITTPVHLRALLASEVSVPPLQLVVSATAMLPVNLAYEVEARWHVPLLEIYGSTETGQIATRRTAQEDSWRLWPEVQLSQEGPCFLAHGGHVVQPTALADVLEPLTDGRFLLHGRTADLVNIAGKRSSLAYLNHQLNAIRGVTDGAFFVREDADGSLSGVTRLAALVVAPGLSARDVMQALRGRIDPVFLPRPLLQVSEIPRNATGKLVQHTLRALAAQAALQAPDQFA